MCDWLCMCDGHDRIVTLSHVILGTQHEFCEILGQQIKLSLNLSTFSILLYVIFFDLIMLI